MALEQGCCASFMLELLQGIHDLDNDTFKLALYTAAATIGPDTTAYTTSGEATGAGYTAGGAALAFASSTPKLVGRIPLVTFDDVVWAAITSSFRGALAYNSSKSNRAWFVIDFGGTVTRAGGEFRIPSPTADGNNAIFRMFGAQ